MVLQNWRKMDQTAELSVEMEAVDVADEEVGSKTPVDRLTEAVWSSEEMVEGEDALLKQEAFNQRTTEFQRCAVTSHVHPFHTDTPHMTNTHLTQRTRIPGAYLRT